LQQLGTEITVVEIERSVYVAAREAFGFPKPDHIFFQDARAFVDKQDDSYDYIVHDVFSGGSVPQHLFSKEFFMRLKKRLKIGGIIALVIHNTEEQVR